MASGDYLLDTSVVVDLLRGVEAVRSQVNVAAGVCISATVLGELLYGAERSAKREKNLREIREFLLDCPVLSCDQETARVYSVVRADLARKGRPIPDNDIWIAATAMQYGLTLAARDEHFAIIDGLHVEHW